MFKKDKVKRHNRLIKTKSGFKVTRIGDFLRKRDDNKKRNIVIGTAAVIGAGGIALLLRKKGVKVNSLLKKSTKYPKGAKVVVKDVVEDIRPSINNTPSSNNVFSKKDLEKYKKPVVEPRPKKTSNSTSTSNSSKTDVVTPIKKDFDPLPDPWKSPIPSKYQNRGSKLLVRKEVSQNRIRAKEAVTSDPWSTPVKSSIKESTEKVVQETNSIKLLSPAKSKLKPEPRGKLLRPKSNTKVEESLVNMRNTQKNYDSLPLDMKVTVQMEKALTRPIKSSNLGRQPDTKGLKVILGNSEKLPIEKVISKAKRKVSDRLKRQNERLVSKNTELKKKQLDDIIPSPSRRAFLKKVTPKLDKDTALTMIGDLVEPKALMGKSIRQMNQLAKNPELAELNIKVTDAEWERGLQTVTGRREMIGRTKNGISKATESLVYARVVKPKIIKTLMGELKSKRWNKANPKSYAERLKRIEENLADLYQKQGIDYKKIGRRDLLNRTARIMEPEINGSIVKLKKFATDPTALTEVFYGNPELSAGLKMAGIKDKNMIKAIRLLMFLGGG